MNKYRYFLILIVMIVVSSCAPYGGQLRYRFKFINNSDKDIYIVIDNTASPQHISSGSLYDYVYANNWKYIDNKNPWDEIISEAASVYILDASLIDLLPLESFLSADKCEAISQEMILDKITVHHEDFLEQSPTLSYPSNE